MNTKERLEKALLEFIEATDFGNGDFDSFFNNNFICCI